MELLGAMFLLFVCIGSTVCCLFTTYLIYKLGGSKGDKVFILSLWAATAFLWYMLTNNVGVTIN
jgi:hypothetical protein